MNCPSCNSEKIQKKGFRNEKQKYRCTCCGASFTEGTNYKPAPKLPPLTGVTCPKCGGVHIARDGKLLDGAQRYKCLSCNLYFSTKTSAEKINAPKEKCPYCGEPLTKAGLSKSGNKAYYCSSCKKSCTGDENGKPIKRDVPFYLTNTEVTCPYCESDQIFKSGFLKGQVPRYRCKNCKKIFSDYTKDRLERRELIKTMLSGVPVSQVALQSGYTASHLYRILKPYYKKEVITLKQKQDIIRYGYYLKMPPKEIHPYIKCTEHKCREVLRKYENKIKSTTCGAT